MKRILSIALCLTIMLSFAACGREEAPAVTTEAAPQGTADRAGSVQLANPYITCKDAAQMQDLAGLEVSLPAELPDWVVETVYRTIPDELIEVIYAGEGNEIRVRIAQGDEDISGVYDSDIQEVRETEINGNTVHLKSQTSEAGEVLVFTATWNTQAGRTYSVTSTAGVPEEIMTAVISAVS